MEGGGHGYRTTQLNESPENPERFTVSRSGVEMKSLFVGLLLVGLTNTMQAQSLDIAGVEIQLGQSATSARAALSAVYSLEYDTETHQWYVWAKMPLYEQARLFYGSITVVAEKVTEVSKSIFGKDRFTLANDYTQAIREISNRSQSKCLTSNAEDATGEITAVNTTCGRYLVNLSLPQRFPKATVDAAIHIIMR
jgi:hypothetical protein